MADHQCIQHAAPFSDRPIGGAESELVNRILQSLARPDAVVERVVTGPKFVGLIAGGRMGLASLLGAQPTHTESDLIDKLIGKAVVRTAEYLMTPSPFAICLGLAAVNAANTPDTATVVEPAASAETLIAELGQGATVGVVGQFPFVEALRQQVGHLHLFELRNIPGAVPVNQWETVLSELEVLAVTGTALLTRQMAYFLSHAKQATIVVLGPTTPISPALFSFGADYLCGSVVTDPQRIVAGIEAGLPFRELKKGGGIRFTQWTDVRRIK